MSPVNSRVGNVLAGALIGWLVFTTLVGWMSFSALMASPLVTPGLFPEATLESAVALLESALWTGFWAVIVAGIVSLIVTMVIGFPLAYLTGQLLRNVSSWKAHVAALFATGALAAMLALGPFLVFGDGDLAYWGVIQALASAVAGLSAALGWIALWKFPPRRGTPRLDDDALAEDAYADSVRASATA